jgi:azobenzene reductase
MKIAILLGSVRTGRQTHKIAFYVQKKLIERGHEVLMLDLGTEPVPLMDERYGRAGQQASEVNALAEKLKQADAIILVSPEYHGSFTGVLKNALDYYWTEFMRKPMGVIATGSGRMGGINASTQLQHVILSMGAYPLPYKLLVPQIQLAFDEQMQPAQEELVKNTERFLDEFLWFTNAIAQAKGLTPR